MCLANKTLRGLFNGVIIEQLDACMCIADVAITDVRADPGATDAQNHPQNIARRFAIGGWQVVEGSARSTPMSTSVSQHALEQLSNPSCARVPGRYCNCGAEKCDYGFLQGDPDDLPLGTYDRLRNHFRGTLWSMLSDDVRNQLSSALPEHTFFEMRTRTNEVCFAQTAQIGLGEGAASVGQLRHAAEFGELQADALEKAAAAIPRGPLGRRRTAAKDHLDQADKLREKVAYLNKLARMIETELPLFL